MAALPQPWTAPGPPGYRKHDCTWRTPTTGSAQRYRQSSRPDRSALLRHHKSAVRSQAGCCSGRVMPARSRAERRRGAGQSLGRLERRVQRVRCRAGADAAWIRAGRAGVRLVQSCLRYRGRPALSMVEVLSQKDNAMGMQRDLEGLPPRSPVRPQAAAAPPPEARQTLQLARIHPIPRRYVRPEGGQGRRSQGELP
jgi:hypothetical protein